MIAKIFAINAVPPGVHEFSAHGRPSVNEPPSKIARGH